MGRVRSYAVALVALMPLVLGTAASRRAPTPLLASAQEEQATTGPLEGSPTDVFATESPTVNPTVELPPASPTETLTQEFLQPTPTPGDPEPLWDLAPSEADVDLPRLQGLGISGFLHDQMDYPDETGSTGVASQNFESARDTLDSQAADDFDLPYDTLAWNIETVEVDGFYVGGGERVADSVNLWLYADDGGRPGREIYSAHGIVPTDGVLTGHFVLELDPPVRLLGGKYWVSVQANLDFLNGGRQWAWRKREVQAFSESVWRNPANGFGTGCTSWTPRISGCGFTPGPDMLFRLGGTSEEIPEPKHTLSVYVSTRNGGDLYTFGHQLGREATTGVVILDYGKPSQIRGIQGTNLVAGKGWIPIFDGGIGSPSSVQSLTRKFIRGWEDGYWGSGGYELDPYAHIAVVVGTSNCGYLPSVENTSKDNPCVPTYPDETNLTPEHAQAWAQMVSELLEEIIRLGYSDEISVFAGSDIQLAWNRPEASLAWLDAYIEFFDGQDTPSIALFDFGSCEGCSYIDEQGQVCSTESCLNPGLDATLKPRGGDESKKWVESWTWNLSEVLFKAAGSGMTLPIPEIYATDGTHARQWYGLSRYSLDTHLTPVIIPFLGVLTQCKSEAEPCSSRPDGNTPSEGWHQMLEWLAKHPSTRAPSLDWLTTIEYLTDSDVCFDC